MATSCGARKLRGLLKPAALPRSCFSPLIIKYERKEANLNHEYASKSYSLKCLSEALNICLQQRAQQWNNCHAGTPGGAE